MVFTRIYRLRPVTLLLVSVVAPKRFSVVFTDWLSMMAPLGVASRLAAARTRDPRVLSTGS